MHRLPKTAVLVAGLMLTGCGDHVSLAISPELSRPDDSPGNPIGIGLSEDFGVHLVRCPSSLHHPDCSWETAENPAIDWNGNIAALSESENAHFRLTGLTPGTDEITVDARGVAPETFVVTTAEIGSSAVHPLFSYELSDDGLERVFVDSQAIPIGQSHYSSTGSRLLGYAEIKLSPRETEASLFIEDDFPERGQFVAGDRLGRASLVTDAGGLLEIEIVDESVISGFDIIENRYNPGPVTELTLSESSGPRKLTVRSWDSEGRWLRGNGSSTPVVTVSSDHIEIIATPEQSDLPWHKSFAVSPIRPGQSEVTVIWAGLEYDFRIIVSD